MQGLGFRVQQNVFELYGRTFMNTIPDPDFLATLCKQNSIDKSLVYQDCVGALGTTLCVGIAFLGFSILFYAAIILLWYYTLILIYYIILGAFYYNTTLVLKIIYYMILRT